MSLSNRRRGRVSPPPAKYDPEWENQLRRAFEESILKPDDFTNSYPFNSPYLSGGRIEVTQISNVTGGWSNVTGEYTKTSPHDEESETDGSHHWVMRQWRPPSYCGTAYYASPSRLPESVSVYPNVSGFRLDYDNLAPWSSYDAIADALASTDTKICFQALVGYSAQATLMGGAVSRVDDEMLAETKSYWQMSLADLRDGVASHALSIANYQYVSNNASGSLLPDQGILDVTSPLEAVDNPGAYCTTIRINATAADKYLYSTGIDTWAEGAITAAGRAIIDDVDATAQRVTLGLVIGTNVQAYDADLTQFAGLTGVLGDTIYGTGAGTWGKLAGQITTTRKFLRQTGDGALSAAPAWDTLVAGDIPSLAASIITSGQLALARGGTNADLSATGGANQIVRQNSAGGAFTVSALAAADIPNLNASKITAGTLAVARGGTNIGSYTIGDLLYASGTTTLSKLAASTSGYVLTSNGAGVAPSWQAASGLSGGSANKVGYWTGAATMSYNTNFHWDNTNTRLGIGNTAPARALEVLSTSAQIRASYSATIYTDVETTSTGRLLLTQAGGSDWFIGIGGSITQGPNGVAIGYQANGSGNSALAIGRGTSATAAYDTAIGYGASASGGASFALGNTANASNVSGTAIGDQTAASGQYSTAIGFRSAASGNYSVAIGRDAVANGSCGVAIGGIGATAGANEFVCGGDGFSIDNVYFSEGKTNATPTAWTLNGTGGSGSNIAGGNLNIAGGKPTGSGVGGSVIIQTAPAAGSSSTLGTLANRLTVDQLGNIVPGTAALATNATDGHFYIPTCAGTPTGVPTTFAGRCAIIMDTTNHKLYVYDGGWTAMN